MKPTSSACHTVMLIDDNEIDNYINEKLLKTYGYAKHVFTHTSVTSALEFLKNIEKANGQSDRFVPEYIFLDLNLPILDGHQFLEEFKTLSLSIKSRIKIVILTCSLIPEDRERTLNHEYGVDFFSKPLCAEDLTKLIWIEKREHCDAEHQEI